MYRNRFVIYGGLVLVFYARVDNPVDAEDLIETVFMFLLGGS